MTFCFCLHAPMWFPQRSLPLISRLLLGRKVEDVYPTFYRLNTRAAITAAATNLGLVVREFLPLESTTQTSVLGPFVIFEMLLIRLLRLKSLSELRTNVLALRQRPPLPKCLLARFSAVGLRSGDQSTLTVL